MININLTPNYAGFRIEGTYDDFDELYDAIMTIINPENGDFEYDEESDDLICMHVLGFLYELRHAYQGSRYIITEENGLNDEQKAYYGIKKSTKENVFYGFDYVLTDLVFDIIAINHFEKMKTKKVDKYDACYNLVHMFYGKAIDTLCEIIPEDKIAKIKANLNKKVFDSSDYYRQWSEDVAVEYLALNKEQRKSDICDVLDDIYNYTKSAAYHDLKEMVDDWAKERKCKARFIDLAHYPNDVEW